MVYVSQKNRSIEELVAWDQKYYLHPTTSPKSHLHQGPKVIFRDGEGIYARDVHGDAYIDGVSALWNVTLGYHQEEIAAAAKEQMNRLPYASSFSNFSHEPAILLARKLASLAPGDLNTVFFTSGGSESNDTVFKLSRFYWKLKGQPQRTKIIALERSYHGMTIGAPSATGLLGFSDFVGAYAPDFFHAKPHQTNCELGDETDPNYDGCIRDIIEKEGPETIAAIILEPVQGSGGVYIPPEGYLKAVRKLCDQYGILFIADEVICGFGRTGQMFGVNNWNIIPDLMVVAKGMTSGYSQLGAVLINDTIRHEIVQYDDVLALGFTYSGHPVSCSVALKTLEILERDQVVANAKNMEKEIMVGFQYLEKQHPHVTNIRALGLMSGFDLFADPDGGKPFDYDAAKVVVEECFKRKLIVRPLGFENGDNVVGFAPPLIINKDEIEKTIFILDEALTAFENRKGSKRRH